MQADLNQNSNYDSLRASQCTSCSIQADKSAYWTPSLYYEKADGSFVSVPDSGVIIYYLGRGVGNATAFPPGFRMLSGSPGLRSYNAAGQTYGTAQYRSRPIADRVSFNCIDYDNPRPETHGFPSDFNCPQGFRAQIHFPTCWDGVNLYKTDQSHVAYLSSIDNGICPPTHPVLLPHLFYETYYAIDRVQSSGPGRFVLSTGDLTGYGYHGDFLNGWDPAVQEQAVANCLADKGFGTIEECPTLLASNDNLSSARCPLQPPLVAEQVTGVLAALPGCNPPTAGPAAVTQQFCPPNGTSNSTAPSTSTINSIATTFTTLLSSLPVNSTATAISVPTSATLSTSFGSTSAVSTTSATPSGTIPSSTALQRTSTLVRSTMSTTQLSASVSTSTASSTASTRPMTSTTAPSPSNIRSSTTSASPSAPTNTPSYTYVGCYSDIRTARTLPQFYRGSATDMTVSLCASLAGARGLRYFGLEYGGECWAANTIRTAAEVLDEGKCNRPCTGDSGEICGGADAIGVFETSQD